MPAQLLGDVSLNGIPGAASGSVRFYQPTTLIPVVVYSNDAATAAITQPIALDANGRSGTPVYVTKMVRMIVYDVNGAQLQDIERADGLRAETTSLVNTSWPLAASEDAAWTLLATSLGGTNGLFKASGVGAGARSVQTKLSEQISVKDFLAKGDGVTDDTAAIVSSISAAALLGGAIIFFPPGTYLISQALSVTSSNITFLGAGPSASIVKNTSATANAFTLTGTTNSITFDNLGISNSGTSTGSGIQASGLADSIIVSRVNLSGHKTGVNFTATNGAAGNGLTVIGSIINCNNDNAANICVAATIGVISFCQIVAGQMKASLTGALGTCVSYTGGNTGSLIVIGGVYGRANVSFAVSGGTGDTANLVGANCTDSTTMFTASGGVRISNVASVSLAPATNVTSVMDIDPRKGAWGDTSGMTSASFAINGSYTPAISTFGCFRLNGTAAGITVTVNNPTVADASFPSPGARFTIIFQNTSGGAVTWAFGANYRVAAVAPASGLAISVTFIYDDGFNFYREMSRGGSAPA